LDTQVAGEVVDGKALPSGVAPLWLVLTGSLPNVLQGLPIGAGPLKSDTASRVRP
jgi:hypothetical protein